MIIAAMEARRGARPDRSSPHHSTKIARGGEPLDLRYKGRTREQARIIMLIDISGSMSVYSLFLLRFAHAMHRYFRRASTFVFSTSLVNVDRMLRSRKLRDVLKALADCVAD